VAKSEKEWLRAKKSAAKPKGRDEEGFRGTEPDTGVIQVSTVQNYSHKPI